MTGVEHDSITSIECSGGKVARTETPGGAVRFHVRHSAESSLPVRIDHVATATGELTALWEFHCGKEQCSEAPYPDEVQRLIDEQVAKIIAGHPSMDDLIIKGNQVGSRNRLVKLEFGDIIRGLALERGIAHLEDMDISNAMIDIGGNVRTTGTRGEHDWWIGITGPAGKHSIASLENIDNKSVVTVRAFDRSAGKLGPIYRHIVDPRSGLPM